MKANIIIKLFVFVLISACSRIQPQNRGGAIIETPTAQATVTTNIPAPATSVPSISLPPPSVSGFPYAATLNEQLPRDGLVLAAHIYADNTCYDVGVYNNDSYMAISCLADFTYPTSNGTLTAYQSKFLKRWVETFQSFDEPSAHGLFHFAGTGSIAPERADVVAMQALIEDIEWTAREYVHQGGYPPAVFRAREVLSQRLNMWLDNSNILKFEAVDFPDSCLGAPKPNEVCEQVITSGFRIYLVANNLMYEYNTDVFGYDIRPFGDPQIAPTQGAGG